MLANQVYNAHQTAELAKRAISTEVAASFGVRSVTAVDQLPEGCPRYWTVENGFLPGLLIPWIAEDGRTEYQLRPDNPPVDKNKRPLKYVTRSRADGHEPVIWVAKRGAEDGVRLIVEGTCQTMAAATYAPEGVWVLGLFGCRGWMRDGAPIDDLAMVDGYETVVALDADMWTNQDVWDAGSALQDAMRAQGAKSVRFVKLPAGRKSGLDDVLAARAEDKRADFLANRIDAATVEKFARSRRPKKKVEKPSDTDGRPLVITNGDGYEVIESLLNGLKAKFDGQTVFNHGGVLTELKQGSLHPITIQRFKYKLQEAMKFMEERVSKDGDTSYAHSWPRANDMDAAWSEATSFAELKEIRHAPFVRTDGTLSKEPGYDADAGVMLLMGPEMRDIRIPDAPTVEDMRQAAKFLLEDWLGDFCDAMPGEADRANLLALLLTPAIRSMVPIVPVAVVNGLQAGVGKNLLGDAVSILATGEALDPMAYTEDNDELRKLLTASFAAGNSLFVLDEAHVLRGASFARAVTAETYSDRILGASARLQVQNRATWMTLGNAVRVEGDMSRRVYEIALRPKTPDPHNRKTDAFRHPDFKMWTRENRPRLIEAQLTLVRGWVAAGKPKLRSCSFGSFERWESIVGSILELAGVSGFLANQEEVRSENSMTTTFWGEHLEWLYKMFGDKEFMARDAAKLMAAAEHPAFPPGLGDFSERDYVVKLGMAYNTKRDVSIRGHRLRRSGKMGNATAWRVERLDGAPSERLTTLDEGVTREAQSTEETDEMMKDQMTIDDFLAVEEPEQQEPEPTHTNRMPEGFVPAKPESASELLSRLAFKIPDTMLRCPNCGDRKKLVPPAHIWYACQTCHPGTFSRQRYVKEDK